MMRRWISLAWTTLVAVGCGGAVTTGTSDGGLNLAGAGGSTPSGDATPGAGGNAAATSGAGGAAAPSGAGGSTTYGPGWSEVDGCLQSDGQGGCGQSPCPSNEQFGLDGCCFGYPQANGKSCCGISTDRAPALREHFGLGACAPRDQFRADVSDVSAPACSPSCNAACPGIDVSALFGATDVALVGCCRADGLCGGSTASLPRFTQSVFGAAPVCLSEAELNAAFEAAMVPWSVPVTEAVRCGGG